MASPILFLAGRAKMTDYRGRVSIDVTKEQLRTLQKVFPLGYRNRALGLLVKQLIVICENAETRSKLIQLVFGEREVEVEELIALTVQALKEKHNESEVN